MDPQIYADRLARLRPLFDTGIDAIAIVPGANMVYFAGLEFHLSERPTIGLITPDGDGVRFNIIVPFLESPKLDARPDLRGERFAWTDTDWYEGTFARALDILGLRGKTIGVDGMTMRVSEWLAFLAIDPALQIRPVEKDLVRIRAIKSPVEVAAMREAIQISERALARLMSEIEPGVSETAIAARLSILCAEEGAHGDAFAPLVQSGENSANPHGFATARVVREGEFLLIDYGARYDGYPADITRTFCLGTPTDEMRRLYDAVLRGNEAARAIARPGVKMGDVDKAARDVIEAAGYGEYFTHRTGHGLGLEGHEPSPQIAPGVEDVLEPGMMFTIEPGVYVPGVGGVRIEDNVLVTADGLDVLTSYPRQLTP